MSSRKAILNKPLLKSEELERILVRIFFKDYVVTAYLSDRLFLAHGHSLKRFPPRFLALAQPQNIRLNSV